jgi:hypothetical protein
MSGSPFPYSCHGRFFLHVLLARKGTGGSTTNRNNEMQMKASKTPAMALVVIMTAGTALAVDLYWDANGTTTGAGMEFGSPADIGAWGTPPDPAAEALWTTDSTGTFQMNVSVHVHAKRIISPYGNSARKYVLNDAGGATLWVSPSYPHS